MPLLMLQPQKKLASTYLLHNIIEVFYYYTSAASDSLANYAAGPILNTHLFICFYLLDCHYRRCWQFPRVRQTRNSLGGVVVLCLLLPHFITAHICSMIRRQMLSRRETGGDAQPGVYFLRLLLGGQPAIQGLVKGAPEWPHVKPNDRTTKFHLLAKQMCCCIVQNGPDCRGSGRGSS